MDVDFLLDAIRSLHAEIAAQIARAKAQDARIAELEAELCKQKIADAGAQL